MSAPPGWYPDPEIPGMARWWDGQAWGQRAPSQATPAADPPRPFRPVTEREYERQRFERSLSWRLPLAAFAAVGLVLVTIFGDRALFTLDIGPELPRSSAVTTSVRDARCVERWNTSRAVASYRAMVARSGRVLVSVKTFGSPPPVWDGDFPQGTCGVALADANLRTLRVYAAAPGGDFADITENRWAGMVPLSGPADVNAAMRPDGTIESVTPVSS